MIKKIGLVLSRIPRKVRLLIKSTSLRFFDNQGVLIANGLAFKTIVAIAPVLAIIAGTLRMFPQFPDYKQGLIDFLKDFIVPESFDIVVNLIDQIFEKSGTISIISVIVFIYFTLDLLVTLDNYIEKIWATNFKRGITQKFLKFWALLSATPFVLGGYFYYSGLVRSLLAATPLSEITYFQEVIHSGISFILLTLFFFTAYVIIPSTKIHLSKAFVVSSIISIIWISMRFLFTYYTRLMLNRWSILYGSFAIFIIFVFWTSFNWIVLLYGVEFLCVWQNKLYYESPRIKEMFLFDVAFILMILEDFFIDFNNRGRGYTLEELARKYRYNQKDLNLIVSLLKNEGFLVEDMNKTSRFFLRKNANKIKLSDIETIVWLRLTGYNYRRIPRLEKLCDKLSVYYYSEKHEMSINLRDFYSKKKK